MGANTTKFNNARKIRRVYETSPKYGYDATVAPYNYIKYEYIYRKSDRRRDSE